MLYAIIATDVANSLETRQAARPAHLERLQKLQAEGRVVLAGPHPAVDSNDPGAAGFSGSLMVVEFDSWPLHKPGPRQTRSLRPASMPASWSSHSSKSCRKSPGAMSLRGSLRSVAHYSRLPADNLSNLDWNSGVAMRKGPLCLLLVTLAIGAPAHGEESTEGNHSTPLSLSAGGQIAELQQRLKDSERQREELSKQLQSAGNERESALLARLRQENQRLKLQLKEAQASPCRAC